MTKYSENLLEDNEIRMNGRVETTDGKVATQILDLIHTCPILEESYHSIITFFTKNSLDSFPECDEILDLLISYINDSNLSICCHGIRCIYYILCQKTFTFEPEFTLCLCENMCHLVNYTDPTIFCTFLKVLYYISTLNLEYAQFVKDIVAIDLLKDIVLTSDSQRTIFAAFNLFKMYIKTDTYSKEVSSSLCEVADELIKNDEGNINIVIETVKLCLYFARKNKCWVTIFQSYQLFDTILTLFEVDSIPLKINIINLITDSFKHPQRIDQINFQGDIIPLINHDDPNLQNAAINCIGKCLQKNPKYIANLVEMDLLEQTILCIQNGSFKSRVSCIPIFENVIYSDESKAAVYLDENLLSIFLELIPEIQDSSTLNKIFNIIKNMIYYVEQLGDKDAYQELLDQLSDANFDEIYDDFMDRSKSVQINKSPNNLLSFPILSESLRVIMHNVMGIESKLESM